jgi:hypothetical protein
MVNFLVGLGILIIAALLAFDESSTFKKVINCVIGGIILGVIVMMPLGVIVGIIAPGAVNPLGEDMLFGGFLGGIIGAVFGLMGGVIVFALSMFIGYIAKHVSPARQN